MQLLIWQNSFLTTDFNTRIKCFNSIAEIKSLDELSTYTYG